MDHKQIETIVKNVLKQLKGRIRIEASGRHVHLSKADAVALFGRSELTPVKELSQPGQYLCQEKVRVIGPKGDFKDVAVLGPCRGKTQVELSMTDARAIGVKACVRDSGQTDGVSNVWLSVGDKMVHAPSSTIVARRHVHMSEEAANTMGVSDGDQIDVRVHGERTLVFENVLVRVNPRFTLSMHIDYDEANAVGLNAESYGEIVVK